jgi:hypothetical protein
MDGGQRTESGGQRTENPPVPPVAAQTLTFAMGGGSASRNLDALPDLSMTRGGWRHRRGGASATGPVYGQALSDRRERVIFGPRLKAPISLPERNIASPWAGNTNRNLAGAEFSSSVSGWTGLCDTASSTEMTGRLRFFEFICILIFFNNSYFTTPAKSSGSFLITDLHAAVPDVLLRML